jgi:hypothetical protein
MEGKRKSLFSDGCIISLCQASSYTSERRFVSVTGGKPVLSSASSGIRNTNLKFPECVSYWVLELERSEKGVEEDEEACLRYGQTFRLRRWRHSSYLAMKRVIPGMITHIHSCTHPCTCMYMHNDVLMFISALNWHHKGSKICPVYLSPNPEQTLFRATPRNRVRRDGNIPFIASNECSCSHSHCKTCD